MCSYYVSTLAAKLISHPASRVSTSERIPSRRLKSERASDYSTSAQGRRTIFGPIAVPIHLEAKELRGGASGVLDGVLKFDE